MDVTGTVEGKDQEFTVEIDSIDLWQEIESSVEECAGEAISNYMDYYEHDVDFNDGASQLLREYNPNLRLYGVKRIDIMFLELHL
mgnify:CR=1 FL=1